VYLFPESSLGSGIYRFRGVYSDRGLTTFYGNGLIWSPNGKYIAGLVRKYPYPDFCLGCGTPYAEIFLVDPVKIEKRTVLWSDNPNKFGDTISWFPDGEHIAYSETGLSSGWGTRSISVDGKEDVQFMADNGYPVWRPNHPEIAIIDVIGTIGDWYPVINISDLSTGKTDQIFRGERLAYLNSQSWSANGKILAFSYGIRRSNQEPKPDIYFWDSETNQLAQFTDDEYEYWSASFSPVNNLIVLERVNQNATHPNQEITTILKDLDNNCEVELPVPIVYSASWSPDGQKLVISGSRDVYIVDLSEFIGPKYKETGSVCP
jgi:Tol biopolymer transport system component